MNNKQYLKTVFGRIYNGLLEVNGKIEQIEKNRFNSDIGWTYIQLLIDGKKTYVVDFY